MSDQPPSKRKKSGAEFRKAKKARQHENKQLGSFMLNYLQRDDEKRESEEKTVQDELGKCCSSKCETPQTSETGSSILQVVEGSGVDSQRSEKDLNELGNLDVIQTDDVIEQGEGIPAIEVEETLAMQEQENVAEPTQPSHFQEKHPECRQTLSNPNIIIDDVSGTFDPASLVGLKLSIEEKEKLIRMNPCQPSQQILKLRTKQFGDRSRYCSQQVFFHDDDTRRKWISYSLSRDSLFCISCLLFTDPLSRGGLARANQGNAFTFSGFSNWKKQHSVVKNHEMSAAHANAKVAEVLFLQEKSIASCMEQQELDEAERRKLKVTSNRNIMKRVVDSIILLGKQGLALRGHRESLGSEVLNTGNFLEVLKCLSTYDVTIRDHLETVRENHKLREAKQKVATQKVKGRGAKLTFLSNRTQNNVIDVIGEEITSEIVKRIRECKAWALIADTTPDVSHHEQLSICVRIVNRVGYCSEHLLCCKRAPGATAHQLYDTIVDALKSRGVTFDKIVAETYDGASNMSGCYNGLQAIFRKEFGSHIVYTHCYAHTLNLVLSDSASTAINVTSLFSDLEKTYTLFSQSEKIHSMFESVQKVQNLKVLSLKRVNTVRWNSREYSLKVFLLRYDCVKKVLEDVVAETSFSQMQRATAEGLLESFEKKQILATAYLFREIFVITGPLSRYLQSVNVDLGKALAMIDSCLSRLQRLRNDPDEIIKTCENECHQAKWKETRVRRRRVMDGEIASDEPETTPIAQWKRETFHVAVDTVINSMRNRFEKNRPLLQSLAMFSPSGFAELTETFQNARDMIAGISSFCTTYGIDPSRCAEELFTFAPSFSKFNRSLFDFPKELKDRREYFNDLGDSDSEEECYDDNDHDDSENSDDDDNQPDQATPNKDVPSFLEALKILLHPAYHLVDAYPTLCKVYAIAVAIPISSSTAERSFSALKRVKTRIRSTMLQERLEALLLMAVERQILQSLDKERIIDMFAKTSRELTKALL